MLAVVCNVAPSSVLQALSTDRALDNRLPSVIPNHPIRWEGSAYSRRSKVKKERRKYGKLSIHLSSTELVKHINYGPVDLSIETGRANDLTTTACTRLRMPGQKNHSENIFNTPFGYLLLSLYRRESDV